MLLLQCKAHLQESLLKFAKRPRVNRQHGGFGEKSGFYFSLHLFFLISLFKKCLLSHYSEPDTSVLGFIRNVFISLTRSGPENYPVT